MDKITRDELIALGGDPGSTHACFRADGSLYFCVVLTNPDEDREAEFWRARGYTFKVVV